MSACKRLSWWILLVLFQRTQRKTSRRTLNHFEQRGKLASARGSTRIGDIECCLLFPLIVLSVYQGLSKLIPHWIPKIHVPEGEII